MHHGLLPPLWIVVSGATGALRSFVVDDLRANDRVSDLAARLGFECDGVVVDGVPVAGHVRIGQAGLRAGSVVGPSDGSDPVQAQPVDRAAVALAWLAGPDAGRIVDLRSGRHLLGRRRGIALAAADDRLAPHHALVDVAAGAVSYTGLAGVGSLEAAERRLTYRVGERLAVGSSLLEVRAAEAPADQRPPRPIEGWTEPLIRPPRRLPPRPVSEVEIPPAPDGTELAGPGAATLTTAAVSLIGGVVMVVVTRQLLMLLMAGVAALSAIVMWVAQTIKVRRRRRTARRDAATRLERLSAALAAARHAEVTRRRAIPSLLEAAQSAASGVGLWERRAGHPDALEVVAGIGVAEWWPSLLSAGKVDETAETQLRSLAVLDDVPVTVRFDAGHIIGIVGPRALALCVARSMVAQLAATVGPADMAMIVAAAADHRRDWEWASWLPHLRGADGAAAIGEAADRELLAAATAAAVTADGPSGAAAPHEHITVVVIDDPTQLASRTSPTRRLLAHGTAAAIVVASDLRDLPAACAEAIEVHADSSAVRHRWSGGAVPERLRICGATDTTAASIARSMARYVDPERVDRLGSLPTDVALADLLGERAAHPGAIAATWDAAGADAAPRGVVGVAADGVVEIDLERDGPHSLIGGTTGAGKSELLRTLVAGLASASPPEALSFVLIDYKGGAAFDACAALPHVVGVVTDLDGRLASRVLTSLEAELHHRESILRAAAAGDLRSYRAGGRASEPLARLVVVVDEFATLAAELPGFLASLVSIAQRGRSLGVHLVLATQRPNGVVNDDIRANTNLRIALRVQDRSDALDIVGDALPASLSRTRPGSAVIRLEAGEVAAFQTARCTGPAVARRKGRALGPVDASVTALELLVADMITAAEARQVALPRRPWLDPLPDRLEASAESAAIGGPAEPFDASAESAAIGRPGRNDAGGAVAVFGERDVVAEQRRDALTWDRSVGHLVVAGSVGSGVTSTLTCVATRLAAVAEPSALHLYVLDAVGAGGFVGVGELPHCGAVVGADPARRRRVLRRLADEIGRRRSVGRTSADPDIVVLIDGYATLADELDTPATLADFDRLESLVHDGPSVGIVVAAGVDRPSDAPAALTSRAASRWLLGLTDPAEATSWGVPAREAVAAGRPGRCLQVESGLEAQIYALPRFGTAGAAPVGRLVDRAAPVEGGPAPLADLPSVVALHDLLGAGPFGGAGTPPGGAETPLGSVGIADANDGTVWLPVGLSTATVETAWVALHEGEHLLVAGPARSGRSTALAALAEAWAASHCGGPWLGVVTPRRNTRLGHLPHAVHGTLAEVTAACAAASGPRMIVIDDAELLADDGGLTALLASPTGGSVVVLASARADALRAAYGHWTGVVRRCRKGILLGSVHDLDADVLGAILPRHRPTTVPVGDGWLVADGNVEAVRLALPTRETSRLAA